MAMSPVTMGPMPVSVDQTADLWLKIDQHHLNYLKSDETTKKIDIRKKLESFIHQYMCLVPQDRKFCNAFTSEIIIQSCRWIQDFSALTAARAFEAIEKYAANLINQPWRKEFREIKKYGGFYKHNVERHLSGGERLFHQMGYMSTVSETLVLEGPIDQDRITTVARDCILAFVECQIIASIVQGVSAHFPCTWEEALVFRRDHIGTPEQAVRSLVYLKNQMRYQQGMQANPVVPGAPYFPRYPLAQGIPGQVPNGIVQHPGQYLPYGYQPPMGYYPNPALHQPQIPGGYVPNGLANGHSAVPSVPTGKLVDVSHDQVGREGSSGSSTSTVTGRPGPIPLTIKHLEEEHKQKSMVNGGQQQSTGSNNGNSLENWDYVYRQLETIGYTKDQAERPDVLELLSQMARKRQLELQQNQQFEQQQQQQQQQQTQKRSQPVTPSWSDDHRQASPEIGTTTSEDESSRRCNGNSAPRPNPRHRRHDDDEVDFHRPVSSQQQQHRNPPNTTSSLGRHSNNNNVHHDDRHSNNERRRNDNDVSVSQTVVVQQQPRAARHNMPLQPPKLSPSQPPKLPQKKRQRPEVVVAQTVSRHWDCHACTFRNRPSVEICEVCSKSRQYGSSGLDSESGGCTTDDYETTNGDEELDERSGAEDARRRVVVCSKCTLENQISRQTCDACGASLHISPIKDDEDDEVEVEYSRPPFRK